MEATFSNRGSRKVTSFIGASLSDFAPGAYPAHLDPSQENSPSNRREKNSLKENTFLKVDEEEGSPTANTMNCVTQGCSANLQSEKRG